MHVMWNYTAGSFFDFLSLLNVPLIPPHSSNQDQFPLKLRGLEAAQIWSVKALYPPYTLGNLLSTFSNSFSLISLPGILFTW